jgi:hypothetical protein
VDIFLRLQLLELIELRSLGWRSNQTVESYYKERFSMLRGDQTPRNNVKAEDEMSNIGRQATCSPSVASHCKQGVGMSGVAVDTILVGGVQLSLSCSDLAVAQEAKQVLEDYFRPPLVKYSRETILRLANSPLTRQPPVNWDSVVGSLPSILLRKCSNIHPNGVKE